MKLSTLVVPATLALAVQTGCAANLHNQADAPADPQAARSAEKIDAQHDHFVHATRDIAIRATLWDKALVSAETLDRPRENPESPEALQLRLARWQQDFVQSTTTVTVLLEIRNRPAESQPGKDPLLTPEQWQFFYDVSGASQRAPVKMTVLGVERFPTRAGGGHWRVAVNLHFPREAQSNASGKADLVVMLPEEPQRANHLRLKWPEFPIRVALAAPRT